VPKYEENRAAGGAVLCALLLEPIAAREVCVVRSDYRYAHTSDQWLNIRTRLKRKTPAPGKARVLQQSEPSFRMAFKLHLTEYQLEILDCTKR
jgi:hypothetical protein